MGFHELHWLWDHDYKHSSQIMKILSLGKQEEKRSHNQGYKDHGQDCCFYLTKTKSFPFKQRDKIFIFIYQFIYINIHISQAYRILDSARTPVSYYVSMPPPMPLQDGLDAIDCYANKDNSNELISANSRDSEYETTKDPLYFHRNI